MLIGDPIWTPWNKRWYSNIFHTTVYHAQYDHLVFCDPVIKEDEEVITVLPPQFKPRSGRPRTKRMESNVGHKRSRVESNDIKSFSDDEEEEEDDEEDVRVPNPYHVNRDDDDMIQGARLCSFCGLEGHNCNRCPRKDISYIIKKSPPLLKLLSTVDVVDKMKNNMRYFHVDSLKINAPLKARNATLEMLYLNKHSTSKWKKKYMSVLEENNIFDDDANNAASNK